MVNHPPLVWRNHGQSEAKIWHTSNSGVHGVDQPRRDACTQQRTRAAPSTTGNSATLLDRNGTFASSSITPRQQDDYRGRALQGVGTRRDQILPQFRVQARQGIGTRHNEIRGTSCHPPPPKKIWLSGEVTLRSRPSASARASTRKRRHWPNVRTWGEPDTPRWQE